MRRPAGTRLHFPECPARGASGSGSSGFSPWLRWAWRGGSGGGEGEGRPLAPVARPGPPGAAGVVGRGLLLWGGEGGCGVWRGAAGVGERGRRLPGISRRTGGERGRLPAYRGGAELPVRPPGTGKRWVEGGVCFWGVPWDKGGGGESQCRERAAGRGSPEGLPGWGGVFPWGCPG